MGMHKQAGTRAGNHQRHTHTTNASPPTQANNATRATNGNPPARPPHMHLTNTLHPVLPRHQPQTQRHGTHCGRDMDRAAHTKLKPGQPPGARDEAQTRPRGSLWMNSDTFGKGAKGLWLHSRTPFRMGRPPAGATKSCAACGKRASAQIVPVEGPIETSAGAI